MTTEKFLSVFGLASLRDLPDLEKLEDAGLLTKDDLLAEDIPVGIGDGEDDEAGHDGPTIDDLVPPEI